jgi:hypothetical protein
VVVVVVVGGGEREREREEEREMGATPKDETRRRGEEEANLFGHFPRHVHLLFVVPRLFVNPLAPCLGTHFVRVLLAQGVPFQQVSLEVTTVGHGELRGEGRENMRWQRCG